MPSLLSSLSLIIPCLPFFSLALSLFSPLCHNTLSLPILSSLAWYYKQTLSDVIAGWGEVNGWEGGCRDDFLCHPPKVKSNSVHVCRFICRDFFCLSDSEQKRSLPHVYSCFALVVLCRCSPSWHLKRSRVHALTQNKCKHIRPEETWRRLIDLKCPRN